MEQITKENLWNELKERYPELMQKFCDWIDKYKRENKWGELFDFIIPPKPEKNSYRTPKFHEIPAAMQFGIFLQFASEVDQQHLFDAKFIIREWFRSVNKDSAAWMSMDIKENTEPIKVHDVEDLFNPDKEQHIEVIKLDDLNNMQRKFLGLQLRPTSKMSL